MQQNTRYWIWLSILASKVNLLVLHKLLKMYDTPYKIWSLDKNELQKIGLNKREISEIQKIEYRQNLDNYMYYMKKHKIHVIGYKDKNYPEKLKNIYDPPIVLYAIGDINILNQTSIGIVGCRLCSNVGRTLAQRFAYSLAKNNIVIVSGLARGIDASAHIGCIKANGKTIAVLGSGLDIVYPPENNTLYKKITETGLVITEYINGTKPTPNHFPRRNRIISGLSKGVLIVEAGERSGSLITADLALEEGKEVYAIPGNINQRYSQGTNELIKQGAKMVTNIQDIIQDI